MPLFSPTTYKAEHKTTFLFSMALTCVSSVVIPACSALLLDQRCLGSFFARPAGESVGITEHLCTAHGFLTRNCTGGKAFAASFVSAVDHPVRVDDTCPAAVLQVRARNSLRRGDLCPHRGVSCLSLATLTHTCTTCGCCRPLRPCSCTGPFGCKR